MVLYLCDGQKVCVCIYYTRVISKQFPPEMNHNCIQPIESTIAVAVGKMDQVNNSLSHYISQKIGLVKST